MICKICGKEFEKIRYMHPNDNICSDACFDDNYWLERANNKNEFIIIDRECYYVGKEEDNCGFKGFDGRKFKIRMMNNGKEFTTTNLWYNGRIPQKYLDILQDNAEFIK